MNDDQMDELLRQGVRDYNAPREVPRDEMWKRIAEARAERRVAAAPAARPSRVTRWAGVGIAAAVILSAGIVVGRSIGRTGGSPRQSVAANIATPKADTTPIPAPASVSPKAIEPDSEQTRNALIKQIHDETNKTGASARALASAPTDSRRRPGSNESLAYRLVVLQHLAGSEAMITAFRSDAVTGKVDPAIAKWSKDLLSTTRVLESSSASEDPVMKRLLGDLDLVISQIVQYTTQGVADGDELSIIEQTIARRGVMGRLRSTNSTRVPTAGL